MLLEHDVNSGECEVVEVPECASVEVPECEPVPESPSLCETLKKCSCKDDARKVIKEWCEHIGVKSTEFSLTPDDLDVLSNLR